MEFWEQVQACCSIAVRDDDADRQVQAPAPDRFRRDGGGLPGSPGRRRGLREAGLPEADPPAPRPRSAVRGDVPERGAAGRPARPSEHRQHLRSGRSERQLFHRHGVHRWAVAARGGEARARARRAAPDRRGGEDRIDGGGGAALRPRSRGRRGQAVGTRAPGHLARQHPRAPQRDGESRRLRHRQGGQLQREDADRRPEGESRVHAAGAAARRSAGSPRRRLRSRRRALRDDRRPEAMGGRQRRLLDRADHDRGAEAALDSALRCPRGVDGGSRSRAREGSRGEILELPRSPGGPRGAAGLAGEDDHRRSRLRFRQGLRGAGPFSRREHRCGHEGARGGDEPEWPGRRRRGTPRAAARAAHHRPSAAGSEPAWLRVRRDRLPLRRGDRR